MRNLRIRLRQWVLLASIVTALVTFAIVVAFFSQDKGQKKSPAPSTTIHLQNDSLKSALIDLHILGDCSLLLVTKGSGFSTVAESMAFPSPVYFIPVNRTILPRLNDTSQIYLRESSLLYFVYYKQFTRQNAIVSDRIIANDSSRLSKVQLFISFIPMVLMMVMSLWGVAQVVSQQWGQNSVLVVSGIFLFAMAVLMILLGASIMLHHLKAIYGKKEFAYAKVEND